MWVGVLIVVLAGEPTRLYDQSGPHALQSACLARIAVMRAKAAGNPRMDVRAGWCVKTDEADAPA